MTFRPTKQTCMSKVEAVLATMGTELTAPEICMLVPDEPHNRVVGAIGHLYTFKAITMRVEVYRGIQIPLWKHSPSTDTRIRKWKAIKDGVIVRSVSKHPIKRPQRRAIRNKF